MPAGVPAVATGVVARAAPEVGGHGRARDSGHHNRAHERGELAQHHEHEQTAEPVQRAEEIQEVADLDPGRSVGEGQRSEIIGNQPRRMAKRNWSTSSGP